MTLLAALLALVQTPFAPLNHLPLPPSTDKFDFVVMGDNRPTGKGLPATETYRSILEEVEALHPAFVISSGDLVYGNEEPIDMYKKELDEISSLLSYVDVPYYNAPGNHEMAKKPEFEAEYTARFGTPYGRFQYGKWSFWCLATDLTSNPEDITGDQMTAVQSWSNEPGPKFVFMHHPIFARATNLEATASLPKGPQLHALLAAHGVKAVFQSHDHVYNYQQKDGVDYYISGGAGAPLDAAPQDGGFFHFLIVHVDGEKYTVDVIPVNTLRIAPMGANWVVSNYADVDLVARNLTIDLPQQPASVVATVDKKGKPTPVEAHIVSSEKSGSGWKVHLALTVTKHRNTLLTFQ